MQIASPRADRLIDPRSQPVVLKRGSKKDTRRWCGGRFGVDHATVWQFWFEKWDRNGQPCCDYQREVCVKCGRNLGIRTVPSNRPSHEAVKGQLQ